MIRIDLSRDELARGGGTSIKDLLKKIKLPQQLQDLGGKSSSGQGPNQSAMLIALLISGAASLLPTLFLNQYKQYVVSENEAKIKAIRDSIAQVNENIVKLEPYQKELESFENQKKQVRARLDVIRSLLDQRGTPVNILDALGQNLPPHTWIQSLDMTVKNNTPQFNIKASSMSNDEVSDFVDKLSESVYFSDVVLNDVGSSKEGHLDVKKFSLAAFGKTRGLASTASDQVNQATPDTAAPGAAVSPNPAASPSK